MSIQDVMARHGAAIREGDVDGVLADYAEESVIMSPERAARGLAEIRDLFVDLFTNLIPPGLSKLEATWTAIEGEYVFVVWKGESERHRFPIGTDTFVVRDDKIVFQTFVAHTVDK
jgi:ketosteroid isomerase-like protein